MNENYDEAFMNLKESNQLAMKLYRLNTETMTVAERTNLVADFDYRWELYRTL
jgi:hypothetical protein